MAARLVGSYQILNCESFGVKNRVTVTTDANGVAIGATINLPAAGGGRASTAAQLSSAGVTTEDPSDDQDSDASSNSEAQLAARLFRVAADVTARDLARARIH